MSSYRRESPLCVVMCVVVAVCLGDPRPAAACGGSTGTLLETSQVSLRGPDSYVQDAADGAFDSWAEAWPGAVGGFELRDMFEEVFGEPNEKYISDIHYVSAFQPCNPTPGSSQGPTAWLGCRDIDSQVLSERGRMWSCDILVPDSSLLASLQILQYSGFDWVFSDWDLVDQHTLLMEAVIAHEVGHLVGARGHMDSCGDGCERPTMASAQSWFQTCSPIPIGVERATLSGDDTSWLATAYADIVSLEEEREGVSMSLTCDEVVVSVSAEAMTGIDDAREARVSSLDGQLQIELARASDRNGVVFVGSVRDARWLMAAGQRLITVEFVGGGGQVMLRVVAEVRRECVSDDNVAGNLVVESDVARAVWRFQVVGVSPTLRTVPKAVEVFDLRGRQVKSVSMDERSGEAVWDGYDQGGVQVAPGVYLARAKAGGRHYSAKVLVLR